MEPNRLPKFGQSAPIGELSYTELQPADHTSVCFAAAIGRAMRERGSQHGEETGRRALAMLADGTARCICTRPRAKRRGRGR